MSEYTPSTTEVRGAYGSDEHGETKDRWLREFDRWLIAHDREVAAKTLTDAVDAMGQNALYVNGPATRTSRDFYIAWLRARAAALGAPERTPEEQLLHDIFEGTPEQEEEQ